MSISAILTLQYTRNGEQIADNVTITADGEDNRSVTLGAASTDTLISMTVVVANLKMLYIACDQDITLETNSSSAPDDTLTILADKPLVWYYGCGLTNPLGTNVTAMYATNPGAEAELEIRILKDATP